MQNTKSKIKNLYNSKKKIIFYSKRIWNTERQHILI
jgi:hypothetical protein